MKKIYLLLISSFFLFHPSFGQSGTWTWISGSNVLNAAAVFGTQGTPSANNHPPAIYDALEWKDKNGNFWIYGGTLPSYNTDLWKFNPCTWEWTWVKGNGSPNQPAVYGTQGIPNIANTPGVRSYTGPTWVDTSGALWLMGGNGAPDDLWKYDISTNMWTWVKGSMVNVNGVHGVKGTAAAANTPGNRDGTCSAWTDASNNLWLFGGFGYQDNGTAGCFNDLWKYSISTNQWTWMKGSALVNQAATYGTMGTAAAANVPGGRFSYSKWKDATGNFWLLGGLDYTNLDLRNDLWKYTVASNNWTWMDGPKTLGDTGKYGTTCSYINTNSPGARWYHRSGATDNCGKFWLFGGFGENRNLNDLWVFDPVQTKWNLVKGSSNSGEQPESYGTEGVPALTNMPHSRGGAVAWWGNDNKFYMFGGQGDDQSSIYSDMWMFTPDTTCASICHIAAASSVSNFQASQTSLCSGECISFTDLSTNVTAWNWTFAGASTVASSLENPANICYSAVSNYDVKLVTCNLNYKKDSVTFSNYISVVGSAPAPIIKQTSDTLYFHPDPSYISYQWYKDAAIISLATDTLLYIGTDSSTFSVVVTGSGSCSNSAAFSLRGLPIELLHFDAAYNGKTVDLLWSTASEINNNFFTVERTQNGMDFTTVAKVNGTGTSDNLRTYHTMDDNPLRGVSGYRLKQTDFDGHYTYSNTVAVRITSEISDYLIFPNPANSQLTIYSSSTDVNDYVAISVMNVLGGIASLPAALQRRGEKTVLDISGLAAGIYFVQLKSESGSVVKKFVNLRIRINTNLRIGHYSQFVRS